MFVTGNGIFSIFYFYSPLSRIPFSPMSGYPNELKIHSVSIQDSHSHVRCRMPSESTYTTDESILPSLPTARRSRTDIVTHGPIGRKLRGRIYHQTAANYVCVSRISRVLFSGVFYFFFFLYKAKESVFFVGDVAVVDVLQIIIENDEAGETIITRRRW